jgi:MipA family protein
MHDALRRCALCLLAAGLIHPEPGVAQTPDADAKSLDGYLGAGVMVLPRYSGGAGYETIPVPLAMIEYRETAYVHLDRAGVRLWNSRDKTMALGIAAQPRFGFHARDGAPLAGMATRRDAIEGGAAFEWQLPSWALSAAWFTDWSGASGGQSFDLTVERDLLERGTWDVSAYLDLDYAEAKVIRYYFGVRPDEATVTRPAYRPGAALTPSLGLNGAYLLNKRYALLFGSELSRLGAAAADSPIVQRRTGVTTYLGLGLAF